MVNQSFLLVDRDRRLVLGTCVQKLQGWKFQPSSSTAPESRHYFPTARACLPAWAKGELMTITEAVAAGIWGTK
jgi:hypothetical protein